MDRIKKILKAQWKNTPLWTKVLASVLIVWSIFYLVDAGIIFAGQTPLKLTGQTFSAYTLVLKVLVGIQLVLLGLHIVDILNEKTLSNPNISNLSKKTRVYFRKIHPLLGITVVLIAFAHSLWMFAQFLTFTWPWTVQIISGLAGIISMLLVALSGDGILFAPVKQRQKMMLIHTIVVLIFLVPFFVHI